MQPPSNLGSFGSATGGISEELKSAILRRQGGNPSGPLGATSNTAPTNNPLIQRPPGPMTPVPGTPPPTSLGTPGLPPDSSEASLIVKALGGRLQSLSKIQGA